MQVSRPAAPTEKHDFVLFRDTNEANRKAGRSEYVGSLRVSMTVAGVTHTAAYAIEADVIDYPDPTDPSKTRKYFGGRIRGGQAVLRELLRGARASGAALPPDLVSEMEGKPFDDPLPDLVPMKTAEEAK